MNSLVERVLSNVKNMDLLKDWEVELSQRPQKHRGYKLDAGNIVMGPVGLETDERIAHNIDISGSDIGIKLQNHKLFDQISLEKWGVFYQDRDSMPAKTFVAMMEKVLLSHDYQAKPMAMFPISGYNVELWREEIKDKLMRKGSSSVQVIILLIPGKNGRS
jgi:hypothetical protein